MCVLTFLGAAMGCESGTSSVAPLKKCAKAAQPVRSPGVFVELPFCLLHPQEVPVLAFSIASARRYLDWERTPLGAAYKVGTPTTY